MTSNVYTKNEILQSLSVDDNSIDKKTLDKFIKEWHIEAVFEDARGTEFFDENALATIKENIFAKADAQKYDMGESIADMVDLVNDLEKDIASGKITIDPVNTFEENTLGNESDKTPDNNDSSDIEVVSDNNGADSDKQEIPVYINDDIEEIDDMSLLSESFEAQEKLRQYVISELSKKNLDITPPKGEFKLDVSEKTLNMIAKAMGKKIAKYVCQFCAQDLGAAINKKDSKGSQEYKKLEKKANELEEQNKKLRLLLIESNRNLNSYKPSIFGFYRKVKPEPNK